MAAASCAVRGRGPADRHESEYRCVVPALARCDVGREHIGHRRHQAERTCLRQAGIGARQVWIPATEVRDSSRERDARAVRSRTRSIQHGRGDTGQEGSEPVACRCAVSGRPELLQLSALEGCTCERRGAALARSVGLDPAEAQAPVRRFVSDKDLSLAARACSRCRWHLGTLDHISPRERTGRVPTALLDPRSTEGAGHSTGEPLHQTVDRRDRFSGTEDSSSWRTGRPSKSHPESRSSGFLGPAPGPFRRSSPHARSSTRTEDRSHRSLIRSRSTDRRSIPTTVCLFFSLGRARSSSDHSCVSSPKSASAIDLIAILLVPSNAR